MDLSTEKPEIPAAFLDKVKATVKAQRELQAQVEPEAGQGILPCGIFHQPPDVIQAAVPVMLHYRAKDYERLVDEYRKGNFDPEKPAFCQHWGNSKHYAEVLAYYGATTVGYLLLIPRARWQDEYELD